MAYQVQNYIAGKNVSSVEADTHELFNPAQGEMIAKVVYATDLEVEQAVCAAKNAFVTWSALTPLRRARVIFKFKELLEKNTDKLAQLVTHEHGKVLADAKASISRAIELVEFSCGMPHLLKGSYSQNVGTDIDSYTIRQPLGVCVGVTPFNFPVMVPIWMFIPAIACGNTFILKPSEKDPSAPVLLAELMHEAGLPAGVLNVLHGEKAVVEKLITHPDVSAVSCVGSTPVAQSIYQTSIVHGKRAQSFGGAKNHCVVLPDADLDGAASAIVGAAFGSAGERCMALSVVVAVGDAVADALIERMNPIIEKLKIGSGLEVDVDMGPLISRQHLDRVQSYVDTGVEEGAKLVIDGRKVLVAGYENGFFMGACLFDEVTPSMHIYREEIFGPVLCVLRVASLDDALQLINNCPYGNGTAIFTRDGGCARSFATKVQVGMVGVNVPIPVPVAYHTFGGWKQSMFGDIQMHGSESMRFYTRSKSITQRWFSSQSFDVNFNLPSH